MEPITVVLPRPRSRAALASIALHRSVSMTGGAEAPLQALRNAPAESGVHCHPYDEAVVRHLLDHVGREDCELVVDPAVVPGTLALSLRLSSVALAS